MTAEAVSERRVKEIIAEVYMRSPRDRSLTWQEIGSQMPLYSLTEEEESLGLDSLDAVEIAIELEEAFDVVLPPEIDPLEVHTVDQITELLKRLRQKQGGRA